MTPLRTFPVQLVLLALIASVAPRVVAADYSPDVTKWITVDMPTDPLARYVSPIFSAANRSQNTWVVSCEGEHVTARLAPTTEPRSNAEEPTFSLDEGEPIAEMKAEKRFLRVDDGWFVGYNAGEFGASLWWFSTEGRERRKLSDHQINQFITTQHGHFAVEGLAHISMSRGSMIQLRKENGTWKAKTFAALPQSAEAVAALPDGAFVVVTSDMLLSISPERDVSILVSNGDWATLYPNSIAVTPSRRIYVGMRHFVVSHDIGDKDQRLQFLVPDKSFMEPRN